MPTPLPLTIRPLGDADLPALLRLSTQAGWNQLAADWLRLLNLWPGQCLGGCVEGQVVATATLATYGREVGWVGMVLVEKSLRGQGHGGRMMQAILQLGERLGIACLGLDATDLGQPVYAKCGFETVSLIDRWTGPVDGGQGTALNATGSDVDWNPIESLDCEETGLSRGALLRALAGEPGAAVRTVRQGGAFQGFGLVRRGRVAAHIGPIVARDPSAAAALFDDLLCHAAGYADLPTVYVDVPRGSALTAHLEQRGFSISRRLARMLRPTGSSLRQTARILAIPGFELG